MVLTRGIRRVQVNTWVLFGVAVVWLAINVRWLISYRQGQILEIDEAGYIGMALNDHYAAVRDGVLGWIQAVEAPGIQAPVTPALTSLQFFVTGTSVVAAFAVPMLAGLAIILLTHAVANRVAGRPFAWLATALVATMPGVIVEARAYHFGAPAAAVTLAAIYFLIRSEGLTKTRSTIAFGVFVGLMPLTRTMIIAFVPALVLAAFIQAVLSPDRKKSLIRFGIAAVAAVGVAAIWLIPNGAQVYRYLTGFGYGPQSAEYGTEAGIFNPAAWTYRLHLLTLEQYLPHVLFICVGLVVAVIVAIRKLRAGRLKETAKAMVASPLFPPAVLVVEGVSAFVTSKTTGNGFTLPLAPSMTLLALWGLYRVHVRLRKAMPVVVAVISLVALVPQLDLRAPTARLWEAELPVVGRVTITDGRGVPQKYAGLGVETTDPEPVSAEDAKQWIVVADWAAQQIVDRHAIRGVTAFGFRDRIFNTNTVQLAVLRKLGYGVAVPQIRPVEAGNSQPDYERWLTRYQDSISGDASTACLLFTATGLNNEFLPKVDPPAMAAAAAASGFAPVETRPLPNGRSVTLWHRPQPACVPS
ncbi:ArnT family glycosyltransferase [Amycolatopsis pittospori]|uniref:ArnT family glycosyltransferase n=1 Tax=Amycolatopsis pittospori TaxID=2749434 RepID=UPI001A9E4094|nr:glycosyltransferase family 39 protein [Amycolatopsis pittospori]